MKRRLYNPHAELCAWANGLRPDSPQNDLCSCRGNSLDHLCRVHGNHPSNIERPTLSGECDNTIGGVRNDE